MFISGVNYEKCMSKLSIYLNNTHLQMKGATFMKAKKIAGILVLVIGIIVLILSLLADVIGIGGSSGFGTRQIIGTIVGAVMAAVGFFIMLKK